MDMRFLTLLDYQSVHLYKFITLTCFVLMTVMAALGATTMTRGDMVFLVPLLLLLWGRFAVEYRRLRKCAMAFVHNDELVLTQGHSHRQIPLASITAVKSQYSLLIARRYRSWTEHVAFLQVTLNTGERVYTLVESAVLEVPPGKETLAGVQAAVLAAKGKRLAQNVPL
ncbi:MAG: hypothetical protein AAAB16_25235 [Pseudomonas sp.]|uniref:hypothetical protein n=1 Tax=Pseudomonas sp. TaxID=306 RepID=UPI0030F1700C